jgi:hypothetical protein
MMRQLIDYYLTRARQTGKATNVARFDPSAIFPYKPDALLRLHEGAYQDNVFFLNDAAYEAGKPLARLRRQSGVWLRRMSRFMPEYVPYIIYLEEMLKSGLGASDWESAMARLDDPDRRSESGAAAPADRREGEARFRRMLAEITGVPADEMHIESLIAEAVQLINMTNGGRDAIPQEFKNGRVKELYTLFEYLFASRREHSRHSALSVLYALLITLQHRSETERLKGQGESSVAAENFRHWNAALESIFVEDDAGEKLVQHVDYLVVDRRTGIALRSYADPQEAQDSLGWLSGEQVLPFQSVVRLVRHGGPDGDGPVMPVTYTEREKRTGMAKMLIKNSVEAAPRAGKLNVSGDRQGNMMICRSIGDFQEVLTQVMAGFAAYGIDLQVRDIEYFGAENRNTPRDRKPRMIKFSTNGRGTHEIIFFISIADYFNYRYHPTYGHSVYKNANFSMLDWLTPRAQPPRINGRGD